MRNIIQISLDLFSCNFFFYFNFFTEVEKRENKHCPYMLQKLLYISLKLK